MATEDIVGGLFGLNPDMYRQQQQQQVFNRAVALQNLDPFQQAAVGYQQAGYNLAGALGGALGGVDPQLQRISTLNAISKQIDQSSPESMMSGAKMLADAGFQQEAFGLAQYARKANSELALAKQRMNEGRAAAIPKEVQIAEYTATLRNAIRQLQAGPQSPETDNQIAELQGRLDALPQPKEATQNADVFKAQRAGQIVNQLAVIRALPKEQQSPEAIRALETELAVLNPPKEGTKSELARLIAERAQAQASGASPQILADYDAAIKKQSTFAPPISVETKVNAYVPASETAQQDFIKAATDKRKVLENAPDTLDNIEAAKKLIPTASTFMGKGGEPLLAAASFLNNRLGFNISTKGVTDATVLRTRLFEGILDNLKKLDSQPSQEQQRVLSEALGNLGTDPAALEQILDRIAETVRARVERYNTEVTDAEGRGVKFPYTPQLKLPPRKAKLADGAAQIPTGKPAATATPMYATNGKERIMSTDGGKTWSPVR